MTADADVPGISLFTMGVQSAALTCAEIVQKCISLRKVQRSSFQGLMTCCALKSEGNGKEEKLSTSQQQQASITQPVRRHLQCQSASDW